MSILVTGGAGYIGSHTVVELSLHGYSVVIVDNLVNSSYDSISRVEYLVKKKIPFFNVDLRDSEALSKVFDQYKITGVIHFAALKAVGESTKIPLDYYENNVGGTVSLLKVMKSHDVKTIVFSSSATVYGDATRFENMIPIPEECPLGPTNPYGNTKLTIENILHDLYSSDHHWRAAVLRYFNPIGAHPSGLIGEDPLGIPNNLLPYLAQVAVGRREKLSVFGDDYDSHDGTPIRDYIHVVDLAKGHLAALAYLHKLNPDDGLYREWNLGTGKGSTVFDVYHAFSKAVGRDLPYEVVGRRAGDVLNLTAKATRANTELGWKAELSVEQACKDLWNWTTKNPFGFHVDHYSVNDGAFGEDRIHTVKFDDFSVSVANHGATLVDIQVDGAPKVCNFKDLKDYNLPSNPYFGATIGRIANRLPKGRFSIDGKEFVSGINDGRNSLHGGFHGFNSQYFFGPVARKGPEGVTLSFVYLDKDGNNGYPGDLLTTVNYIISPKSLEIEYQAELTPESSADATAVSLTNHSYFHLTDEENINNTEFKLVSSRFMEVDKEAIPTGKLKNWTDPDVTKPFVLSGRSFDHCFIVDEHPTKLDTRSLPLVKVLEASNGGKKLSIYTTEPSFQFYTGDGVNTKGYGERAGFAVEPCRFISAGAFDEWRNQVVVRKGEVYGGKNRYVFS
ncbi:DEKNAAC103949 [Brettanomyces naardenensis]|uniref:DEKNAAC103949 n=1 Tax=Brettanomyces naardenensis TaxID=13370 RepID=A0A448YPI7_BRENA|nr:DEKNAAC103949 [Brettanomyces naardenensis]